VRELVNKGHHAIVVDNLSEGNVESIPPEADFVGCDLADTARLDSVFKKNRIDKVIHMAALSIVNESMKQPLRYLENNVNNGIRLLNAMVKNNVKSIIFSSTASVYGDPDTIPISESARINPNNMYGVSKVLFENILADFTKTHSLKSVSLRYFNAAGADPKGGIGEDHRPETHLIPLVIKTALGLRDSMKLHGTDYRTKDSTAVRDFVHVTDLAKAHILALEKIDEGIAPAYNLGGGKGCSVKEIIDITKRISKKGFTVVNAPRREGDPEKLVASSALIKKDLGWKPRYSDIDTIIKTALRWHENNPEGYAHKTS